jgi:triosephosphate isomerase
MRPKKKMIVGANWKAYKKSCTEVSDFVKSLKQKLKSFNTDLIDTYILPDFLCLQTLIDELEDYPVATGTQDIFWEDHGPYTGVVPPMVLADMGGMFVFIGHSDRKKLFGETNETINKKVLACYRNGLIPILLVGETKKERSENNTIGALREQLAVGLRGIPPEFMSKLVIVYEPVWAIGQKDSAPPDIIEKSHQMVRDLLKDQFNSETASICRIVYGGSVNIENGKKILKIPGVDGLAISRSALDPRDFASFIQMTEEEAAYRLK